jgi:hypothetical protein
LLRKIAELEGFLYKSAIRGKEVISTPSTKMPSRKTLSTSRTSPKKLTQKALSPSVKIGF